MDRIQLKRMMLDALDVALDKIEPKPPERKFEGREFEFRPCRNMLWAEIGVNGNLIAHGYNEDEHKYDSDIAALVHQANTAVKMAKAIRVRIMVMEQENPILKWIKGEELLAEYDRGPKEGGQQ